MGEELKNFFRANASGSSLSLADQQAIYRNLPLSLQIKVARHISRDSLAGVELFQNLSECFLDSLSTLLTTEVASPGAGSAHQQPHRGYQFLTQP